MIYINEEVIDKWLDAFEEEQAFEKAFVQMINSYPDMATFIDAETQGLLSEAELSLLEFLTAVICQSCTEVLERQLHIPGASLEKNEEANWETFNAQGNKQFTAILDVFFSAYPQEDLLALVEDSLQSDEESVVSQVGREIIFISCKSIIDTIDQNN